MKTPEDACAEYAKLVAIIRAHTRSMQWHWCSESEDPNDTCLRRYWRPVLKPYPGGAVEVTGIPYEELCDNCKASLNAFRERARARSKLAGLKRTIEAIGKKHIHDQSSSGRGF